MLTSFKVENKVIMKIKWGKLIFTEDHKIKRGILVAGLLLLLLFPILLLVNRDVFNALLDGDTETIRATLAGNSLYAYFFMMVVMTVQNSFTIIPLILVITLNIALFGAVNGFLWSWLTSILAGVLVFICVRFLFRSMLIHRFSLELIKKVEENGFTYVFQARIFPFVPTSLINILAGLSSVRFKHFLLGTIAGNFLFFIFLSLIPAGILTADLNEYEIGMLLFLGITIFIALRRIFIKKKSFNLKENNHLEKEDGHSEKRKTN